MKEAQNPDEDKNYDEILKLYDLELSLACNNTNNSITT